MFKKGIGFLLIFTLFFLGNFYFLFSQDVSGSESNYNLSVKLYQDAIDKFTQGNDKEAFQLYLKAYGLYPKVIYFEDDGLLLYTFDKLVKDRYKCLNRKKAKQTDENISANNTPQSQTASIDKNCEKKLRDLETQLQNQISIKEAENKDLNKQIDELQKQLDKKDAQIEDLQRQLEENIHLKKVWQARALRLPPYTNYNPK